MPVNSTLSYGKIAQPCQQCGVIFWEFFSKFDRRKYCDQVCARAAKANPPVERTCGLCGVRFWFRPSPSKSGPNHGRFCSNSCSAVYRQPRGLLTGEHHPSWKGDGADDPAGRRRARKQYLTLGVCEGCGLKPAHDRHHRDGNTRNNARENVAFLCRACHHAAHKALRTHCSFGHEWTPANTYTDPKTGYRQCRTCRRLRQRVTPRTVGSATSDTRPQDR
jgi:hypothetical protein